MVVWEFRDVLSLSEEWSWFEVFCSETPGCAFRRSETQRSAEFTSFHHSRAKLPLSRKPSRRLSIFPRPQSRASPPPNLARSSSPSGTTRRNSCDGAPQLDQGAALRFVGYREFGLFVPWHPAHPREVVGLARGFTQSHRALGRSLSAGRNQWAGVRCESDARK